MKDLSRNHSIPTLNIRPLFDEPASIINASPVEEREPNLLEFTTESFMIETSGRLQYRNTADPTARSNKCRPQNYGSDN